MMSQSWMGTDFTNDDLVRESSMVTDYSHKLLGDTTIQNKDCYIIQMTPEPNAPVVWGSVRTYISKQLKNQLLTKFYDEDGELVNVMKFTNIKEMDGRTIPATLEMIPQDDKGHKTIMTYESIDFEGGKDESFYTLRNMKNLL